MRGFKNLEGTVQIMETKTIDYASSLKEASTPSLLSLMFLESYFALTSGYRYLH